MTLDPGASLGVYEVLGPLGAGGMGEVYRARDRKLGRDVAIKILPQAFAADPTRLARFEREARMLASINHPALAAIYGLEQDGPIRYIVMELVPGETLAETLARGPLPLPDALAAARQIAEALEAAHEKGIVHRDLKPSNVKITPEGRVKVLDLGLAKAMDPKSDGEDFSHSPTLQLDATRPGVILGTVEFMSPEQARGKPVDKRTDVWSFGCVLFEMLSGRRAFTGGSASDVIASILTGEPDWAAPPLETPPRVRELMSRCLQKDANRRLRDIGDARIALEDTISESAERLSPPAPIQAARRERRLALATLAAVAVAGAVWLAVRPRPPEGPRIPGEKYLAVLPFRDLSEQPGGQLLGDGLVEMVSVRLTNISGVQVVTPAAAVAASEKQTDLGAIARNLGANLILRGAVQREGDRLRITYQLYSLADGKAGVSLAADSVEGSAADIFALQDRLSDSVARALRLPRTGRRTPPPSGLETASQQERYLQAIGNLQRYDKPPSVDAAIGLLQTLAAETPSSALVHAALGRAYLYKFNDTRDPKWVDLALRSCDRAEGLAADLPEVSVTRGELLLGTGKAPEAVAAFQRALASQPSDYEALLDLARAFDAAGKGPEAEATYRRAIALQPSYWAGYSHLAAFDFAHGQYAKAVEMFRRVTELVPDNSDAFSNLGATYGQMGREEEALRAYEKSLVLAPTGTAYSNIGTARFYLGRYRESAEAFEKAARLTPGHFLIWANLGDAYRWTTGLEAKAPDAYRRAAELARVELRLNPRNGEARSYLALCLARIGRAGEAEEQARAALTLEPGNPVFLYNAALVSNLGGRSREALERIRSAVEAGYSTALIARDPELASLRGKNQFGEALPGSPRKKP